VMPLLMVGMMITGYLYAMHAPAPHNMPIAVAGASQQAYDFARKAATQEGILCGISSGAALYAAARIAERKESAGKTIVVVIPSSGERYLSTPLYGAPS